MNRIFLTVLIVIFFSARASGQEPDTLSLPTAADSIDAEKDVNPDKYVPLFESDTVYRISGKDTIAQFVNGVRIQAETALIEDEIDHSPTRAIMYALVLPGLGQGYNRKFYKMPIVWAAMGGAGYAISFNTGKYKEYSKVYANNPDDLNERYLRYWRRNMELSYIAMIAVYALQVVDAYVDAQLYSWEVNEDLSMGISPSLQPLMAPGSLTGHAYGLTCSFNLRR